jgi:hypothetical protein
LNIKTSRSKIFIFLIVSASFTYGCQKPKIQVVCEETRNDNEVFLVSNHTTEVETLKSLIQEHYDANPLGDRGNRYYIKESQGDILGDNKEYLKEGCDFDNMDMLCRVSSFTLKSGRDTTIFQFYD